MDSLCEETLNELEAFGARRGGSGRLVIVEAEGGMPEGEELPLLQTVGDAGGPPKLAVTPKGSPSGEQGCVGFERALKPLNLALEIRDPIFEVRHPNLSVLCVAARTVERPARIDHSPVLAGQALQAAA